jgi:hypothetical protein
MTPIEFKEKLDTLLKEYTQVDSLMLSPEDYGDLVKTIIQSTKK